MNAILLAGACAGALAALIASQPMGTPQPVEGAPASMSADRGSMTRQVNVDPETGEVEETNVIAFLD